LSLAQSLHPTPAVGGTPQQTALDWIRDHESVDRGWFAGLAGWLDGDGNAELNVILRCALLQGSTAFVHAGAGLVANSEPEQELAETELKLAVLMNTLKEV